MHPHLRPYFVTTCLNMLDAGHHRESLLWIVAFYTAATDIILVDGPETERPRYARRLAALLRDLGMDAAESRSARIERSHRLAEQCFALADDIITGHPAMHD
jgi:hypothetical protein